MRVLANHQMSEQRDGFARRRQPIKGRHRSFHFIADAVHVNHEHRRLLDRQPSFEKTDHARLALRNTETRTRPRSAWHTAAASASAASGDSGPSSLRMLFIIRATWDFSA